MAKIVNKKFKKGAASFYIVAFSTLLLMIVAVSFATVIIQEVSRSSNDDLSQSAYDSALAGIEDAKVAYSNYRRCLAAGATQSASQPVDGSSVSCPEIIWWMNHPDCYMVGRILGKISKTSESEVVVGGETVTGSGGQTTTNQAYTCTQINTQLNDYRSTLSGNNRRQVIRGQIGEGATNDISIVRISWYSVRSDVTTKFANYVAGRVAFRPLRAATVATPSTVEVQMVQTAPTFNLKQFDEAILSGSDSKTNRATLYLVPTDSATLVNNNKYYINAHESGSNRVTAEQVAKTNNQSVLNKPFAVYCNPDSADEFYCTVDIEMPGAIGTSGNIRNNDTFMLSVSLPYQQPDTDFSIEFICSSGTTCGKAGGNTSGSDITASIKNSQISIDSTGRANDLYRRVETRLDSADTTFDSFFPFYALQIMGDGDYKTTKKLTVTSEYNFYF
ncbi:MAG: hypothetical protein Q4B87_02420 [Candidatus Saccharibacteria bacterium]|nr:hypothetical protein [Candidatus Saccharibacteria bacterium]